MKRFYLLGAICLHSPSLALAHEGVFEDANTILVIGKSVGYAARDSVTATKTDTPLIDIPQTIKVVTRQQMDDQAQHSMADVLRYVPGTTVAQGEGNRDQITIRGQSTTADFFLDGVRDDVQYYRNLYNIERVEILKGPYALIFGRGGGGGIINRVQKSPSADRFFVNAEASANSFGTWEIATDVNSPLSENSAFRINGFYEKLNNHRDYYGGEHYAFNPYVAYDLGAGWKAGLSYEYVKDNRVADRGVPSLACSQPCTPAPLPNHRDSFFGVPGVNRTGLEAHIVKARLDGRLQDNLSLTSTILYGHYDKFYTNVYANAAATSLSGTVALAGYHDPTVRENFIAQGNLIWDVNVGPLENKILFGLEYGAQDSFNQRYNAILSSSSVMLDNIQYPSVTFPVINRNTKSKVEFFSAYAQDQISIGKHVDIVMGLRFDHFDIKGTDLAHDPVRPFARADKKVSPRLGLILKPQENISIYGSYSQSFLPRAGDQFLTLSTVQENLEPEKFTNYELGAKWDVNGLSATVAVFQLDRTNATTPDPLNPATTVNAGKTRTRGLEIGLSGRITDHWQVSGGYTHQDAKLRGNDFVALGQVPRHQFALWNRYDFTRKLGAGIGVVRQSSQFAANRTLATTTRLPGFTRVDAAVFYNLNEKIQFQVNVENLLDETYFSDAHNNNNITPGAPMNARVTAIVKF